MFDFIWSTTIKTRICRGCDIRVAFRLNQCMVCEWWCTICVLYCSLCKLENVRLWFCYSTCDEENHWTRDWSGHIWIIITNYESVNVTNFDSAYLLSLLWFTQRSSLFELSRQIKWYVSLRLSQYHMIH